jgi:hypothetical protein
MPSVATAVAGSRTVFARCRKAVPVEFQQLMRLRRGRTSVRRTRSEDIPPLLTAAQLVIASRMASEHVVRRIADHHPDSLWTLCDRNDRIVGYVAMLMLNRVGLEALLSDRIDFCDPAPSFLAPPHEAPAAIYIWGVMAPALAIEGVAEVMLRLRSAQYDSANIYAFQTTAQGARFQERLGFQPVPGHPRNLFQYIRLANRSNLASGG